MPSDGHLQGTGQDLGTQTGLRRGLFLIICILGRKEREKKMKGEKKKS